MDWLDIKEFIKDTLKYILFIIVVLIVAIYVIGLQQIVGDSMSPTLLNQEVVLIDKLTPNFLKLKRGDIISFYHSDSKYLVKRVIGLPGEYVEIKDNKIYIDNQIIEDYISDFNINDFKLEDIGYDKIPDNMYFVMGDNRENSLDSRDYRVGLIQKNYIIGKKLIRLWPIIK
jgi:signal peptidase I